MTEKPKPPAGLAALPLGLLWLYKRTLSPVFYLFGARCRHAPTCSEYAAAAFQKHGLWAGFWLSLSRLTRCHPWGSHGFDPVPETLPKAGWRFWRLGDWGWTERPAATNAAKEAPPGATDSRPH
ncbi:MAG: membrane protein insertion efficiency factor YidD [Pseudomonadota bacterium]